MIRADHQPGRQPGRQPDRDQEDGPLKICVVSDAWYPQINGVVRTLDTVRHELRRLGHRVYMITPDRFLTVPCPTYPEIRLAVGSGWKLAALFDRIQPDAIHIATEGPLGFAARRHCLRQGLPFTTAYHTNFPEYIMLRTGIPEQWLYSLVRRFHAPSSGMMVATASIRAQLEARGFRNIRSWSRGVDTELFRPRPDADLGLPRPVQLYVGRVAVEKNLEAFLAVDRPGTKVVVGDGPALGDLKAAYPDVVFAGFKQGEELAAYYAAADVFVFPSMTDTFGLVMLEALASGTPVAALPVAGPLDVIGRGGRGVVDGFDAPIGCLDDDLAVAIDRALTATAEDCRRYALNFSWHQCTLQFLHNLRPLTPDVDGQQAAA